MKVAVYSDIHDNQHNMRKVIESMKSQKVDSAIFLGDFNSPYIVKELLQSNIKTHCIWGNNEGDKVTITKFIESSDGLFSISDRREDIIEVDGKKVALLHHPDFAKSLARSGDFDAVFYAHTHDRAFEMVSNCILANPGEVSGHKTGKVSYILWDTEKMSIDFIDIENIVNVNL